MDLEVAGDCLAADGANPSHRMQDCGPPAVNGSSEVKMAPPSPQILAPQASGMTSDSSSDRPVPRMDLEVAGDCLAADGANPSHRMQDCSPPAVNGSSEVKMAPPSPQTLAPQASGMTSDSSSDRPVPRMDLEVAGDCLAADGANSSHRMQDCGPPAVNGSSEVKMAPPSPQILAPQASGMTSDSSSDRPGASGSNNTSESVSAPLIVATAVTSGRVRRKKSIPKKREMPDDTEFPLNIIVKEEHSDNEYTAVMDASSDADGPLSSGIWTAQNSTNTPQCSSQKSSRRKKKKRSPAFQKPRLIKSSSSTASLMFVIPKAEMETVVDTQKKRKCKKEMEYEEIHWCDICDECFSEASALEEHMKMHLEQPQENFDCEDCGRVFYSDSELEQHRSAKHGKLRYRCDICGIQYNYESQFVIHMRAHSGERPYACDECGQAFGHKCSLVVHQRIHTGVTPHQCKKCYKMLDTRMSLIKHKKMRYCPDCKKCYTKRSFSKHLIKNCIKA